MLWSIWAYVIDDQDKMIRLTGSYVAHSEAEALAYQLWLLKRLSPLKLRGDVKELRSIRAQINGERAKDISSDILKEA